MKTAGGALDLGAGQRSGAAGPPRAMGGGGPQPAGGGSESEQFDIPVEIQGVICIYNPPDREKLGTGAASTENPAAPAAPPAKPSQP
jgi:hypothetical protein